MTLYITLSSNSKTKFRLVEALTGEKMLSLFQQIQFYKDSAALQKRCGSQSAVDAPLR